MHPEIILHILGPLRSSLPAPSPLVGRWEVIINGRKHLVGGWHWISFIARLGCKSRKDFPNEGHVDNPFPKIESFSWKYLPYTQKERDDYWEIKRLIGEQVDRAHRRAQH